MGSLLLVLLEIYWSFQHWKNFANPPRIDKVIAMVRVAPFFVSRCISMVRATCRAMIDHLHVPAASIYTHGRHQSCSVVSRVLLVSCCTRTSTGQRCFTVHGPRTWNRLVAALELPELTLSSFKATAQGQFDPALSAAVMAAVQCAFPTEFIADYKMSKLNWTELNGAMTRTSYSPTVWRACFLATVQAVYRLNSPAYR